MAVLQLSTHDIDCSLQIFDVNLFGHPVLVVCPTRNNHERIGAFPPGGEWISAEGRSMQHSMFQHNYLAGNQRGLGVSFKRRPHGFD